MAKGRKSTKVTPVETVEEVDVAEVTETPKRRRNAKKEVVAETPEVIEETTEETEEGTDEEDLGVEDSLDQLRDAVRILAKSLGNVQRELLNIKKKYRTEVRELEKRTKGKRRMTDEQKANRPQSGFVKPTGITEKLAKFLDVPNDTLIARTKVTSRISAYVRENKLFNPDNKRQFYPDKKLTALLGKPRFPLDKNDPSKGMGYTYFNLQSYLADQFVKVEETES